MNFEPDEDHWEHRRVHLPFIRDQLELLSADLRTGVRDHALSGCTPSLAGRHSFLEHLREMLLRVRRGGDGHPEPRRRARSSESRVQRSEPCPDWRIMFYLARLGLEEHFFAYSSRFPEACPSKSANAFELLQVKIFHEDLCRLLRKQLGLRAGDKLNFFRLAQRIRNENGITRQNSPSTSFCTFEDIIAMERRIEGGGVVDFIIKCVSQNLVNDHHMPLMYDSASNLPELDRLHEGVTRLGRRVLCRKASSHYTKRLVELFRRKLLTLRDLKKYLRISECINLSLIFGVGVVDEDVNKTFNWILNALARTSDEYAFFYAGGRERMARFLKLLLRRGADLFFKDPDEDMSSLAALVKFSSACSPLLPLELPRFSAYICCPLSQEESKVTFDARRLASLSCLAARHIPVSGKDSGLPRSLQTFVDVHRELQSQLRGSERETVLTEIPAVTATDSDSE